MPGFDAHMDVRWLSVSAVGLSNALGPGDDDDDDDDTGVGGGGSGGNIDPDDDEGYDEEDDDEDEEPLQVSRIQARAPQPRRGRYVLHRTKCSIIRWMRRPASLDGCPPHASPDPGNRIIGF